MEKKPLGYVAPDGSLISEHDYQFLSISQKNQCNPWYSLLELDRQSTAPQVEGDWREELSKWSEENYNPDFSEFMRNSALWYENKIAALTSKIEEMRKDGWISVKDRLPEEDKWILLTTGNFIGVGKYRRYPWYKEEEQPEWSDETSEYIHPEPTHWMKLPTPPKPGTTII